MYDKSGLTADGHELSITVKATNEEDDSAASSPAGVVTVATYPQVISGVDATPGNGSVTVTWDEPTFGAETGYAEILSFKICPVPADAPCVEVPGDTLEAELSDLGNGTAYRFRVQARNVVGLGEPGESAETFTPCGPPDAPLRVTARVTASAELTVEWEKPAFDGGCDPLEYQVRANEGSWSTWSEDLTLEFPGLTIGEPYHFTVHARNGADTGPDSYASTDVKAAGPPDPPTDLVLLPGDGFVRACWSPPMDDGFSPVTGYDLVVMPGSIPVPVDAPATCMVVEVDCPEAYTFTMTATNLADEGDPSDASPDWDTGVECGPATAVALTIVPDELAPGTRSRSAS